MQYRKCLIKSKTTIKSNQEGQKELTSDVDIKYQIYSCFMKMKNWQEALQILQSIPAKQRTPKVNLILTHFLNKYLICYSKIDKYGPC